MKEAKKQAEQIPEDKRAEETQANLKTAAERMRSSSKEQGVKLEEALVAMNEAVKAASPKDQERLAGIVLKTNKLLAQLKEGADVNEIVNKIKNLA